MSDRETLKQEIGYWRDVQSDPTATTADKQHARRKVRTLRAQLARTPDTSHRDSIMSTSTPSDHIFLSTHATGGAASHSAAPPQAGKQERLTILRQQEADTLQRLDNIRREIRRLLRTAA